MSLHKNPSHGRDSIIRDTYTVLNWVILANDIAQITVKG